MADEEIIFNKQLIEEKYFKAYARKMGITRYKFTQLTDSADVMFMSGTSLFLSETKVREENIEYFQKYGPFLELKKIEGVVKMQKEMKQQTGKDFQLLYINFASDGFQVFTLKNPWDYNFKWRLLPKNNINKSEKIWKLVAELYNPIQTTYYKQIN